MVADIFVSRRAVLCIFPVTVAELRPDLRCFISFKLFVFFFYIYIDIRNRRMQVNSRT